MYIGYDANTDEEFTSDQSACTLTNYATAANVHVLVRDGESVVVFYFRKRIRIKYFRLNTRK